MSLQLIVNIADSRSSQCDAKEGKHALKLYLESYEPFLNRTLDSISFQRCLCHFWIVSLSHFHPLVHAGYQWQVPSTLSEPHFRLHAHFPRLHWRLRTLEGVVSTQSSKRDPQSSFPTHLHLGQPRKATRLPGFQEYTTLQHFTSSSNWSSLKPAEPRL